MKNILIVDDDAALLTILAEAFSSRWRWCHVLTARSGTEAQRVLERVPVDFVLTDLDMPGMDGYELLAGMRRRHSGVPVLVMTGSVSEDMEERLRSIGVSHYVVKPLNLRELAAEVMDRIVAGEALQGIAMSACVRGLESAAPGHGL
jgi:DNA-binding response OmpR family regulator